MFDLIKLQNWRSKRISSWDKTGGNKDYITIVKGETKTIAEIKGAGCINHIWITISCEDKYYLRKALLRMYWDNEKNPSVDCPLGDFFGVGHAVVSSYWSLPLNMVRAGMNCFFPMPFTKAAKIEVVNECDTDIGAFYFYIDYAEYKNLSRDILRFHAKWRRENPTKAVKFKKNEPQLNLTGKDNYLILDAQGKGHYVGCLLNIENLSTGWWGEGDDMIFIDGEKWPPSLHGTGTEDYFSAGWGFPGEYSTPYHGVSLAGNTKDWTGKWSIYRFHLKDPIVFHKSIRVTIEHGHANNRSDDYSSVAYWYQTEPHREFAKMLPVKERLPRKG